MRLKDVCTVFTDGDWIESKDQSDEGIRLVQTGNIGEGIYLEKEARAKYISEDTFKTLKCTEIYPGDILVSRLPEPIGRACIVPEKEDRMITAVDCTICRPDESIVSKEYLCYFMRSDSYYTKLLGNVTGTTRKRISRKNLGNVELNIPLKKKQKEVVKQLDSLSKVINLRKNEIQLLDNLIKARFVEMFGTPYRNEKGFLMLTVDDVIEFTGGAQPDKKYFEYEPTEDNIRLIQIRDYKTDNYITYIPKTMAKRFCDADDVMIGRYGPPIFQILKGIEGSYNVALMKATPKMGNKEFIRYFLKQECLFNYLDGLSQRTAGQSGIEMSALKAYPFPYPPIELQEEFEQFVHQVDKSKVIKLKMKAKIYFFRN